MSYVRALIVLSNEVIAISLFIMKARSRIVFEKRGAGRIYFKLHNLKGIKGHETANYRAIFTINGAVFTSVQPGHYRDDFY
jgi:hypothetical protein